MARSTEFDHGSPSPKPRPLVGNGRATQDIVGIKDLPVAVIAPMEQVVGVGDTVYLDGTASFAGSPRCEIVNHEWLINDGTLLTGANALDLPQGG